MWLDRKSERENSGEPSQMNGRVDNAHLPYSIVGNLGMLWEASAFLNNGVWCISKRLTLSAVQRTEFFIYIRKQDNQLPGHYSVSEEKWWWLGPMKSWRMCGKMVKFCIYFKGRSDSINWIRGGVWDKEKSQDHTKFFQPSNWKNGTFSNMRKFWEE